MIVVLFNIGISGGAGKVMINLARAFVEQGVETHIISFKESQYKIPVNIFFHKIEKSKKVERTLKEKLNEINNFDVVFSNSTPSNKILSKLNLKNSIHIVHSAETKNYKGALGKIKTLIRKKKYQKLYSNKNLITVSKGLENFILRELKAKPKAIKTIYNPFDFYEIKRLAEEENENIPNELFIVHVARLDITQKRHDILLEAYKRADLPYKLYLIGEGNDREKIKKIIEDLDLNKKVELLGFSPNPYPWIKEAKLLLLSSDFEGFGLVLVEALSLKTPVVSTDSKEGPKEILKGDLANFLVPTGDIEALAKKIREAIENYPDLNEVDFSYLEFKSVVKEYINYIERILK